MPENSVGQSAAILNSDFIAIAIVKDRQVVWANTAMHRVFGYESAELVGRATRKLFLDKASYAAFGREAYAAIADGRTHSGTSPQKRKDGTTGWYEFNVSGLAGCPDMAVVAIVDRTACHRDMQKLEESESRYRSVVEDQTEVISRFLPDGTFLFVNEVYCRLFGKSAADLIGHRWQPVAHPDDVPMVETGLGEMSPDRPVIVVETRVFAAGGELRWMQFVNRGFYDGNGNLKEIQSVGRDITRLKQIESDLRESDERLEMALAASGLVLWDWNIPEHKITAGRRVFQILGYTTEELGTDSNEWMHFINPKDLPRVQQQISSHLQGETASYESEHQLRHKDGPWVTIEAKGKVTRRDKDGVPLRMVGTIQDITMRKRLNEEGMDLLKRIESLIRESSSYTPAKTAAGKTADSLTKRQRQILGLIAMGMTSAEIGKRLHLATPTVISHRRNLMAKLDLHSTAEVTKFAIDHGLLPSK